NHADPDPSDITASGFTGVVTDVNVFVNGLSHTNPDDLEMLLVSPSGQKTDLMNDAGGATDIAGLNISFNDQAAGKIPDTLPIASQGYKPGSDYVTGGGLSPGLESFLSPAPAAPYALTLDVNHGINPNGVWSLYVDDDHVADTGSISGGWSIS